jgi:protocatechuate 3,4-dioxygenase beta subunit
VPGAEVWHFEADWNVWNDRVTDRELYMHAHGTKLLADGAGELRLPALERPLAAVARDGDQYGERILYATSPEPIRLEISPDVSLRIQVVDETGQPVPGVNVGLRRRVPVVRGDLGGSLTPVSASALTQSPDGFATLVHFHQRSPDFLEAGSWGIAAVDAPLAPTVQAEFDPRDPPAEPLQLVLPPTGRLVVLVQDAQGRPLPDNWVQVTPIVSESAEAGRDALGLRADTVSRRGRAEFPHVGLGLALQIESQPSTEWPRQEIRCAGPRTAGEEVVVTLRFDERHPVITGRLVDASGAIRAREQLSGRIVLERRDAALQELRLHDRTDGEGRFRIAIATPCEPEVHCTLHVRTGDSAAGNVLTAEIAPVDPLRAEDVNVGDVVLTAPVIALSGTVRDADGKPIYWAWVDIARKQVPNEPQRPVTYDYLSNRRAMSDKAGRFTVSGELEPGEYLVDVAANGFVHTGLRPFTPGTQGRDVVLERHGELEGSVLLPAGVAADRIVVEVSPSEADRDRAREADPDPRAWTGGSSHALPTGAFRLIEVPPGVVDVRVRLDGEIEPLTRIDGVAVTAGSASTDPRLRPIDLRGIVLRQIEVTIEGPDGARVHSAVVAVRPTGDADADARRILCEDGQLTVVSRWSALDLEVRAPGMRVVRREAVTTDQRVVMEPGIPITVRLPAEFQMPAAPLDLTLMLCPVANFRASFEERLYDEAEGREHQHYQWWAGQAQSFDARRELNFRLPEPGSYQVSWLLVQRSGLQGERWASVRDRREPAETTILESDAGKVIELAPDPPDFVAAQGRMR